MIRILLTLLLILISSTSFAASTSSDDNETSISASEQVTKLYDKAYELVYYKKFDKSIKLLEKIAKRKDLGEKKADVYNLLGFSYRKHSEPNLESRHQMGFKAIIYLIILTILVYFSMKKIWSRVESEV